MSETTKLIGSIIDLSKKVVDTSSTLVSICKSLETGNATETERLILQVTKTEEEADSIFEDVAERIMSVEFLNINPDYLLDIAKHIDQISDIIERAALLFQYLGKFSDQEVIELLTDAATQVNKMTTEFVTCLSTIESGDKKVKDICDVISEREKAVDAVREKFNSYAVRSTGILEQRIWLKDIFSQLDQIADLGRDLSITLRVVGIKLEKQRTLTLKHPK
ncbi:MAG: DUF47 family protein [Nitrososphaerota archaeon]|nr:DUF47 family protein [Nitrososphaerota archaeon]